MKPETRQAIEEVREFYNGAEHPEILEHALTLAIAEIDAQAERIEKQEENYRILIGVRDEMRQTITDLTAKLEQANEVSELAYQLNAEQANRIEEYKSENRINKLQTDSLLHAIEELKAEKVCPKEGCEHYTNHKFSKCYNCTRGNTDQFKPTK